MLITNAQSPQCLYLLVYGHVTDYRATHLTVTAYAVAIASPPGPKDNGSTFAIESAFTIEEYSHDLYAPGTLVVKEARHDSIAASIFDQRSLLARLLIGQITNVKELRSLILGFMPGCIMQQAPRWDSKIWVCSLLDRVRTTALINKTLMEVPGDVPDARGIDDWVEYAIRQLGMGRDTNTDKTGGVLTLDCRAAKLLW